MKLELHLDDKTKIYTIAHATARHFRTLMEYDKRIDYEDLSVDDVDELVGFVCDVFRNQFTIDEFYDGIKSNELITKILEVFIFVRTGKNPNEVKKEKEEGNEEGK